MKLHLNRYGITLAEAISEVIGISLPCGGSGRCGGCAVMAYGKLDVPSESEKALLESYPDGWRLACKAICLGEVTVEIDDGKYSVLSSDSKSFDSIAPLSRGELGAAIDVGTTTLAAKLVDRNRGEVLASAEAPNPQIRYGGDVITRIEYALRGGAEILKISIQKGIYNLLSQLTKDYIDTVVIVGNTAMLTLLVGGDVSGFGGAPFEVCDKFGRFIESSLIGCQEKCGRFYLLPCISAFVGADTTSAILSSSITESPSALLADIGTNGELVLHRDGRLFCTSTAAGPAFEGAQITHGMAAREGAIFEVKLENSQFKLSTVGNVPPKGICAGGLVSAAAALLDNGIMGEDGFIPEAVALTNGISITPRDIRQLQNAKAAVRAGIEVLCKGTPCDRIYLAGGIGNYLNVSDGIRIGLLPEFARGRVFAAGNAALRGACMLLQNEALMESALEIASKAEVIELDTDPDFNELYIENMMFKS